MHSTMVEVNLYISAYSCLMTDQTRMSQYVEVVLAWLRKQSDVKIKQGKQHLQIHHMEIDEEKERKEMYIHEEQRAAHPSTRNSGRAMRDLWRFVESLYQNIEILIQYRHYESSAERCEESTTI